MEGEVEELFCPCGKAFNQLSTPDEQVIVQQDAIDVLHETAPFPMVRLKKKCWLIETLIVLVKTFFLFLVWGPFPNWHLFYLQG